VPKEEEEEEEERMVTNSRKEFNLLWQSNPSCITKHRNIEVV
jgi:hypothetical protein